MLSKALWLEYGIYDFMTKSNLHMNPNSNLVNIVPISFINKSTGEEGSLIIGNNLELIHVRIENMELPKSICCCIFLPFSSQSSGIISSSLIISSDDNHLSREGGDTVFPCLSVSDGNVFDVNEFNLNVFFWRVQFS